ncbi:hypothetical protein C8T65DRAFT_161513 [Cerioporus squamosus]|nr:hypothetical protein C8T65DRAFT_161513 [Cerioporus squamosus]
MEEVAPSATLAESASRNGTGHSRKCNYRDEFPTRSAWLIGTEGFRVAAVRDIFHITKLSKISRTRRGMLALRATILPIRINRSPSTPSAASLRTLSGSHDVPAEGDDRLRAFLSNGRRTVLKLEPTRPTDVVTWLRASSKLCQQAIRRQRRSRLLRITLVPKLTLRGCEEDSKSAGRLVMVDVHVLQSRPPATLRLCSRTGRSKPACGTPGITLLTSGFKLSATGHLQGSPYL